MSVESKQLLDAVCPVSSLQDWSENYAKLVYPCVQNRADILLKALGQHLIEHYVNLGTPLPHKTVATRAGLGWIGKCALLVTKQFGSAIRLTSVLTDVYICCDTALARSKSIGIETTICGRCIAVCPFTQKYLKRSRDGLFQE